MKRNRTSFKPDQLRQMKEYFKKNMNPDSKELRELAFETGLNKRVLQVVLYDKKLFGKLLPKVF